MHFISKYLEIKDLRKIIKISRSLFYFYPDFGKIRVGGFVSRKNKNKNCGLEDRGTFQGGGIKPVVSVAN